MQSGLGSLELRTLPRARHLRLYRKRVSDANLPPSAPTGLTWSFVGGVAHLAWNAAADNAQYNNSWTIKNLPAGTYYWSVQAIDASMLGSAWATEQQFAPDTTPPVIESVTVVPALALAGDPLRVAVTASDNREVTQVLVNGSAAALEGSEWVAQISAEAAEAAEGRWQFKVWGRASDRDAQSFTLDDGSGAPIRVIASGHSIQNNDYAVARGALDTAGSQPMLTTAAVLVNKVD